ncbi:MAG: cupin domain-containing protein [Bacteroidetes bacterium]|nr:cupin domain-containing protein [Bacteroidota bacterium]
MNIKQTKNIFDEIPDNLVNEMFEELISSKEFKLERIISKGHSSPKGFWYDQEKNEFVLLLSGSAKLSFENGESFELKPGDRLIIPPHEKHRVDWTDPEQNTIWLALHY